MRPVLGCHGGGSRPFFRGTDHETDRCPRRHVLDHPFIGDVFQLHRSTDGGHVGPGGLDLTAAALEALDVVNDAMAWKLEQEAKQRERERGTR